MSQTTATTATETASANLAAHVARQTTDALMAAKSSLGRPGKSRVVAVALRAIEDELAARRAVLSR